MSSTDATRDRGPDFLCVGVQKAATSWLHASLGSMPGVFVPLVKESHYFLEAHAALPDMYRAMRREQAGVLRALFRQDPRMSEGRPSPHAQLEHMEADAVDDQWYRGIFAFAQAGDVRGEVCPSYLELSETQILHALALSPRLRVIVLVRDPVERAWSHVCMDSRRSGENTDPEAYARSVGGVERYAGFANCARAIPRWRSILGQQRVMLISHERVGKEPSEVLREVARFLGVRGEIPCSRISGRVNATGSSPIPDPVRARLLDLLSAQYDFLSDLFPEDVRAWLSRHEAALRRGGGRENREGGE